MEEYPAYLILSLALESGAKTRSFRSPVRVDGTADRVFAPVSVIDQQPTEPSSVTRGRGRTGVRDSGQTKGSSEP